jgi:DNA-binding transcriptional ArsR family regulator
MLAEEPDLPLWADAEDVAVADTAIMQSLANPLRLRLLGLLRVYGPSTATKLAARVDESSGLTSYHLRQLASTGLVTEATEADLRFVRQTGGRERWWKAAHKYTLVRESRHGPDAGALDGYGRAAVAALSGKAQRWITARHTWPTAWQHVAGFSGLELRLTPAEAERLQMELAAVLGRYRQHEAGEEHPDGTMIVSAQFQVFPYPEQDPPGR